MERFTTELGFDDLTDVEPSRVPSRAAQLHLSGLIVMADWIASDERHFPGVDKLSDVSFGGARKRAGRAWEEARVARRLGAVGRARSGVVPRPVRA